MHGDQGAGRAAVHRRGNDEARRAHPAPISAAMPAMGQQGLPRSSGRFLKYNLNLRVD